MRQWVLEAEYMLDGTWSEQEHAKEKKEQSKKKEDKKNRWCVTNEEVGRRFDTWRQDLAQKIREGTENQKACECFEQFLQVLANMRPYLIQCYNLEGFPRTNNETEGSIRRIKARYRRISGREELECLFASLRTMHCFLRMVGRRNTALATS